MEDTDELAGLLSEARKGNQSALAALMERLRERVRQRGQRLLGQGLGARLDGSDIAQDILMKILDGFAQFQGETVPQLLAWVEAIIQSHITDCRRRQGAQKRDVRAEVAGDDLFLGLPADATTPSQGAVRNEDQARLTDAIQRLTENERLVFRLRFFEALPFDEVAQRAGVSVGNARVLMVRATEKLRNELGAEHE